MNLTAKVLGALLFWLYCAFKNGKQTNNASYLEGLTVSLAFGGC
jgi:hypothetical protein